MKIGYFADGVWAHKALELIVSEKDLNVEFITPRYDNQDPILKAMAKELGIPFVVHENVNSESFIKEISNYKAELFVSMSFNQILKSSIINTPPLGFINCHAGKLPFYRGRNPLNWVLINGEKEFGITIHYVDEGIDTGDIIKQSVFTISENDNYGTLLRLASEECGSVLLSAIRDIKNGQADRYKQNDIHPIGSYFCQRVVGDEFVDFEWSEKRFHDFVRGITLPGPCARVFISDKEYAIVETKRIEHATQYISTVGEIVGRTSEGNVLKVGDSLILLTKVSEIQNGAITDIVKPSFKLGTRMRSM
ncbi:TPA: methionyl-tRNA formyltransferase [Aeromonas veronii]|uniref:methionyl-tRNA formyltransferase n=1 Tax=Aeromonas veronii TaxID=654 RepID=UPI003006A76B